MSELTVEDRLATYLNHFYPQMKLNRIRMPERFEAISQLWLRDCPYYAEFMFRFNFFETPDIPTFGVNCLNGRINLYFNEKYLNGGLEYYKFGKNGKPIPVYADNGSLMRDTDGKVVYEKEIWPGLQDKYKEPKKTLITSELEAILIHEILHLILLTQERSLDDHEMWNIASDMIINDMITGMNVGGRTLPLPSGGVYLQDAIKAGYAGEAVTEEVYSWLLKEREQWSQQNKCPDCGGKKEKPCPACNGTGQKGTKPCPDCEGTGKTPCPTCGGYGEKNKDFFDAIFDSKIDTHELLADNDNLTESTLSDIARVAAERGYGTLTGQGFEKLTKLLARSKVSWKRHLRKCLSVYIHGSGTDRTHSWSKNNRRDLPLPGYYRLEKQIVFACDVSGSITIEEIEQFFAEAEKIVKDVSKMELLLWDTEVKSVVAYKKGGWRKIEILGRGGTSVQCVFDWMKDNKKTKNPVVVLTDGVFSYNFENYNIETIWCVTTKRHPPKGKVIEIISS